MTSEITQSFTAWANEQGLVPVAFQQQQNLAPAISANPQSIELTEIPDVFPAPAPFPTHALSASQRAVVQAVAEVFQVDECMPGLASLAVAGAAIGKSVTVTGGASGRSTHCNVYVVLGAPKSYGKSALAEVIAPLIESSKRIEDRFLETEKAELICDLEIARERAKGLKAQITKPRSGDGGDAESEQDPEALRQSFLETQQEIQRLEFLVKQPPTLWTGNTTTAALEMTLARNQETIFCYSLEAGDPLRIALGKFNKEKGDMDILLSGYTVENYRTSRVGRGECSMTPCVSLLWAIQPILFDELYGNDEALERGLTVRLIIGRVTNSTLVHDDGVLREISCSTRADWQQTIDNLLSLRRGEPQTLRCTPAATAAFKNFHNRVIDLRNAVGQLIEGEFGRAREHAIRVAGILAALDGRQGNRPAALLTVEEDHAQRAIEIIQWTMDQRRSMLEMAKAKKEGNRLMHLMGLIRLHGGMISLRDLRSRHNYQREEVDRLVALFPRSLEIVRGHFNERNLGRMSEALTFAGSSMPMTGAQNLTALPRLT